MKTIMTIVVVLALISMWAPLARAEQPGSFPVIARELHDSADPPGGSFESSMDFSLGHYIRKQNTLSLPPLMPFSNTSPNRSLPMGAISLLKNERWGAEPAGAVVYTLRAWVGGVQINNIWSFAGDGQDAGRVLIQPFLNYNLSQGWYLTGSSPITSSWSSVGGRNMLTVPVGGGFGKVVSVYGQVLNIGAQAHVYPVRPEHLQGPNWTIQTTLQWLFPK